MSWDCICNMQFFFIWNITTGNWSKLCYFAIVFLSFFYSPLYEKNKISSYNYTTGTVYSSSCGTISIDNLFYFIAVFYYWRRGKYLFFGSRVSFPYKERDGQFLKCFCTPLINSNIPKRDAVVTVIIMWVKKLSVILILRLKCIVLKKNKTTVVKMNKNDTKTWNLFQQLCV